MKLQSLGTDFTFVDLFAGIGGFHLAMSKLGGECVMASEKDEACQWVYRKNFLRNGSNFPLKGAIEEITADPSRIRRLVPEHDVLCAGFPCQPFSKSGYQLGLRDRTRGTLFFHIMEIVRAREPRYVILENVRNLAGPRHTSTWLTIVQSLREAGYSVSSEPLIFSPHLLPPRLGGRPQVRERVFILAERNRGRSSQSIPPWVVNAPVNGWSVDRWSIEKYLQDEANVDRSKYGLRPNERRWLKAWEELIRVLPGPLPGFPIWVDSFRGKGFDSEWPDWKRTFVAKNRKFYAANREDIDSWLRKHRVREDFPPSRRKFEWQAQGQERSLKKLVIHLRPSGIRVRPATYLPTLVAMSQTQTSIIGSRMRRITPREAARLQGFPSTFGLHPNDEAAYRQLGNAVNVGAAAHVADALFSNTATSERRAIDTDVA